MNNGAQLKSFIVITSILDPTVAVKKFSKFSNYHLVVVGDKKTPANWELPGVTFLSVSQQSKEGFLIEKYLPYNHYSRKLLGYLFAIRLGATTIIDTDDDNIPYPDWHFPSFKGSFDVSSKYLSFVNIYRSFTSTNTWPRGFPLELIADKKSLLNKKLLSKKRIQVGIWQGLVNGDPDVDAIFRMIFPSTIIFDEREPVVLAKHTICPFNSQNTAFSDIVFPLLYLPCFVNFRFTDILRGLVAQPILWKYNLHLGFTKPTVLQKRNPHSLIDDFTSEIPCYLSVRKVIRIVEDSLGEGSDIYEDLLNAYTALKKHGIVEARELTTLKYWIKDIRLIRNGE